MGPVILNRLGPPWSVQVIIRADNQPDFEFMQCLDNPLVPGALSNACYDS